MFRITNWMIGYDMPVFVLADSLHEAMDRFLAVSTGVYANNGWSKMKESPAPFFPNEFWFEMHDGRRFIVSKVS